MESDVHVSLVTESQHWKRWVQGSVFLPTPDSFVPAQTCPGQGWGSPVQWTHHLNLLPRVSPNINHSAFFNNYLTNILLFCTTKSICRNKTASPIQKLRNEYKLNLKWIITCRCYKCIYNAPNNIEKQVYILYSKESMMFLHIFVLSFSSFGNSTIQHFPISVFFLLCAHH